jgi:hypothetical protein
MHCVFAAALLAVSSAQAPFAHVHPGDADHHHATGFSHAHLGMEVHHHETEGPEIESHDDDELAVYLDWAPTAAPRIALHYVEAPAVLTVSPVTVSLGAAPVLVARAHSPPSVRLLPARSPPV